MLGFLKRAFSEERWESLDKKLSTAFERVRGDTANLFSWVNYLREKDMSNDEKHQQVNYVLGKHNAMIKAMQQEIFELKNAQKTARISPETDLVRTKSGPDYGEKRGARNRFEKNVMRKVISRRKEYVMGHILKLVNKGDYATSEIENIVVNEKVLCGRTAFYDYMKELRYRKLVKTVRIGEKPVVILA